MSDSDRPVKPSWPVVEQRQVVRRSGRARRVTPEERSAEEERRKAERRSPDDRRDESAWEPVPLDGTLPDVGDTAEGLIAAAMTARQFAQARYSQFKVGAALETAEGTVVTGCNIENATYGLTLCAERVALVKALSEGHSRLHPHRGRRRYRRPDAAVRSLPSAPVGILRGYRDRPRQPRRRDGALPPVSPAADAVRCAVAWSRVRSGSGSRVQGSAPRVHWRPREPRT